MRSILNFDRPTWQLASWSPRVIAVGLALLTATVWWPALPAASGMALVALGATGATIARFAGSAGFNSLLLLQLTIYGALVALCVGARLDLMMQQSLNLQILVLADLAASIWPAAAALYLAGNAFISPSAR